MDKKISVIIPIYNVEKYLARSVDSVLNQTYKNLEVILVDDGSPDGCPAICDEYARRDSRVIALHKKNGGQSSARNAALDCPLTGDYVTFVDSDDWIASDYYEYCVRLMEKTQADVVQIDYSLATDTKVYKKNPPEKTALYEGKEILQHYMTTTTTTPGNYSVWRCLFSRHLIGETRFRNGKINEDIDWKYIVLSKCRKLAESNQVKYFYYQSGNSTSSGALKRRDFQLREAADLLVELTSAETYGTIAFLGRVKQARTAFSLLSRIAYYGVADSKIDRKAIVRELTQEHRSNLSILIKAPIPLSRKILAVMFALNFNLTKAAIKLAKEVS